MNKYTIFEPCVHEIVIEKSRFICSLEKVDTEEAAQDYIKQLKKKYWDATHNCSAYVIGETSTAERSNDDGEPSGTAGLPMLEVLRKNGIYNTVAVVTRYFGGVKLGAGGLVRAYTSSVAEALKKAGLAEVVPMGEYTFVWDIAEVGKILNLLYQQNIFTVADVAYGAKAGIKLVMPVEKRAEAENWLTETLRKEIELTEVQVYGEERKIEAI